MKERIPFDYFIDHSASAKPVKNEEKEERDAEERMMIIMRNGNSGEHYDINADSGIHDTYDDEDTNPDA